MTRPELIDCRRREIEGLRLLLGEDRVCPSAKEEYRKRILRLRREIKELTA